MGKIFGISDLPVSTIMTPFEPIVVPKPQYRQIDRPKQLASEGDMFASTSLPKKNQKRSWQ